jgi:hypothetical protein
MDARLLRASARPFAKGAVLRRKGAVLRRRVESIIFCWCCSPLLLVAQSKRCVRCVVSVG